MNQIVNESLSRSLCSTNSTRSMPRSGIDESEVRNSSPSSYSKSEYVTSSSSLSSQQRRKPGYSRFHRWTNQAPSITLAVSLLLFMSIAGFFLFHALFTPLTKTKASRSVGLAFPYTNIAVKGGPRGKDLAKLLGDEISAKLVAHTETETTDMDYRVFRRIRQNLAEDYFRDDEDDGSSGEDINTSNENLSEFLLSSPQCVIPDLTVRNNSATRAHKVSGLTGNMSSCQPKQAYGIGNARDCCYQIISHAKREDPLNQWRSLVCTPFDPSDAGSENLLGQSEFVKVRCKSTRKGGTEIREEFRANIPLDSAHVRNKIQHWIDHPAARPISVLVVGLNGISRRTFHTSFPLTRQLLLRSDFMDFKGYHIVGPKTLDNLTPLLMGIPKSDLLTACNHRWRSYWDDCPFVWKLFHEANYVTLYAEDIPDSFNYGNQVGFEFKPTDYYFRPLLVEKAELDDDPFCFGNVTTAGMLLGYMEKFIAKFRQFSTPFFAFSWLNLRKTLEEAVDEILFRFFTDIRMQELHQDTLVILLSDHGAQVGSQRQGFHGYLDHRLPIALIQPPISNPDLVAGIGKIGRELTSPFDMHAILRRIPSLEDEQLLSGGNNLFEHVSNRTCAEAGIGLHWCTCNAEFSNNIENSPLMLHLNREGLVPIVIEKLNEMARIQRQSLALLARAQQHSCPEIFFKRVLYAGVVGGFTGQTWDEMDSLVLGVQVFPGRAQFEILLKKEWDKWKVALPIIRVDSKRSHIFCVGLNGTLRNS